MSAHAFSTIKAARTIGLRHPDVPAYVAAVGLAMASYANGRQGTMIRPRFAVVAQELGMSLSQVQRAVRWLEQRNELRRDKTGWRGSAACFTWLGGMEVVDDPLSGLMEVAGAANGGRGRPPTNPTSQDQDPSDPSRLNSGPSWKACKRHPDELIEPGYFCIKCREEDYWAEHGGRP